MMAACTQTKNNPFLEEWNTPYGIPPFEKIQLTDYIPAVKAGIEEQNKELEAILNNQDAPTFENTVAAYELSGKTLTKTTAVLFNLQETEGSDEMNKVVEEATALMTEHEDNISMMDVDKKAKMLAEKDGELDSHIEEELKEEEEETVGAAK